MRSLRLSVGEKFFLCLHLPKFFMQLLVHPVNVLCLGMPEMQVSHICIQRAENSIFLLFSVKILFWGGVGEAVPHIIGYHFNTYY